MANLNDYKLVALKSKKMYNFLDAKKSCDNQQQSRLGFYHLVMENITGIRDIDRIQDLIIDTDYNKYIFGKTVNDLGMDAVHIIGGDDSEQVKIQLFNFKYRNSFKPDKTKDEDSLSRSSKFLEYLLCDEKQFCNLPEDKVKAALRKIRDLLDGNTMCDLVLYIVSNEAHGFSYESNDYIKMLENHYGLKIQTISLDDIIGYFISSRSEKKSKFSVERNDFLSFERDDLSTQKSFVLKVSLLDLVRITCDNYELGMKYNLEDDNLIEGARLDYALLYDNVRGYLGATDYNKNIIDTLENNHKEFFMLNNGITMTATGIDSEAFNSGKKYLFTINNFQIVNGGQTIRSIYNYLENASGDTVKHLRETAVLIRIFKIPIEDELKNRIAEYTNSQNAISSSDLKSVDKIQIQLENYLKEEKILYIRKAGQIGEDIDYICRISKEKTAQILYSAYGYPDRASNQKKRLFQEYYDEIFKGKEFTLEKTVECIKIFNGIYEKYQDNYSKFSYFELKNYYVIYIMKKYDIEVNEAIEILENTIVEAIKDIGNITPSRLLLRNKFKQLLDEKIYKQEYVNQTLFDII